MRTVVDDLLGPKIRLLRQRCGLSIRQLAEAAGVTSGNISCIERGKNSPSIATLSKILTALGTDLQTFFSGNGSAPKGPVYRREHMKSIADRERSYTLLFPRRGDIKVEMLDEHLHPCEQLPSFEILKCDVAGYVISGILKLEIKGGEEATLRAGDAFYVPKDVEHRGFAVGENSAHLITVCYPPRF